MANFNIGEGIYRSWQMEHEKDLKRMQNAHDARMTRYKTRHAEQQWERERAWEEEKLNQARSWEQDKLNQSRAWEQEKLDQAAAYTRERDAIEDARTAEKDRIYAETHEASMRQKAFDLDKAKIQLEQEQWKHEREKNLSIEKDAAEKAKADLELRKIEENDQMTKFNYALFYTLNRTDLKMDFIDHDNNQNTPPIEGIAVPPDQFDNLLPLINRESSGKVSSIDMAFLLNGDLFVKDHNGESHLVKNRKEIGNFLYDNLGADYVASKTVMWNDLFNKRYQDEYMKGVAERSKIHEREKSSLISQLSKYENARKAGPTKEGGFNLEDVFLSQAEFNAGEQRILDRLGEIEKFEKGDYKAPLEYHSPREKGPPQESTPPVEQPKNEETVDENGNKSYVFKDDETGKSITIKAKNSTEAKEKLARREPLYRMNNRTEEAEILTAKDLTDEEKKILTTTSRDILYSFMDGRDLKDVSKLMNSKRIQRAVSDYDSDINRGVFQNTYGYVSDNLFLRYSPTDIVFESEEAQKKYDKLVKPLLESSDEKMVEKGKALFNELRETSGWAQRDYAALVDKYYYLVNKYNKSQRHKERAKIVTELESLRKSISELDGLVNSKVQ